MIIWKLQKNFLSGHTAVLQLIIYQNHDVELYLAVDGDFVNFTKYNVKKGGKWGSYVGGRGEGSPFLTPTFKKVPLFKKLLWTILLLLMTLKIWLCIINWERHFYK